MQRSPSLLQTADQRQDRDAARVRELVRRHGWNATSSQILQRGFSYFFVDDDACVGYVDTGGAWVAAGAPVCGADRLTAVAGAFVDAARAHGRRACFFGTEERFRDALSPGRFRSLLIGEQGVWDPKLWQATVGQVRSLREQLRRARAKGVRVRLASAAALADPGSRDASAISQLVRRWTATHEMPPMGFLVDLDPLATHADHRLYLAELESTDRAEAGGLVGILVAVPIFARRGWLLQAVVRAPDAPNGTAELLVDEAICGAARDDDALVTLGLAPLAGPVAAPLRWARTAGSTLFDFEGLQSFKSKLRPLRWDGVYLSFPVRQGALASLLDVLRAFAHGRLLRFGLQTLLRGPAVIVRLLTFALIPWTVLLVAWGDRRWFATPAVKWGWVLFDGAVVGAAVLAPLLAFLVMWRAHLRRVL